MDHSTWGGCWMLMDHHQWWHSQPLHHEVTLGQSECNIRTHSIAFQDRHTFEQKWKVVVRTKQLKKKDLIWKYNSPKTSQLICQRSGNFTSSWSQILNPSKEFYPLWKHYDIFDFCPIVTFPIKPLRQINYRSSQSVDIAANKLLNLI